ncbi:MAG: hypothetical protein QF570_06515 [Myxococcota bacterium]|jgi:hypothetical protein|nr:hypothetical protein [Myxococcota bacterium]
MSELDAALERFFETDCVYSDGEPNYGPMAVVAVDILGHAALTTGLLDIYLPRLPDFSLGEPLPRGDWPAHVAQPDAAPGLIAGVEQAIAETSWEAVLTDAITLRIGAPGAPGAPGVDPHAVVRLGYAIENLARQATPTRLREFAYATGFLLARCSGADPAANAGSEPASGHEALPATERLSRASAEGADRYLANPDRRRDASLGVILPAALRAIATRLEANTATRLVDVSLMGIEPLLPPEVADEATDEGEDLEVMRCAEDLREVRYRAACSIQEYAIVMAESCLREAEYSPDSRLVHAAADAALRLSPPGYKEWR